MRLRTIIVLTAMALSLSAFGGAASAQEEEEEVQLNHQIIFRGAYSSLTDPRSGEVFTDAGSGTSTGKGGWSMAAALDLSAMQMEDFAGANVMGEIFIEYSQFSKKTVPQATSVLLGAPTVAPISVSELNVTVAPKLRFDGLGDGRFRPFVVPIGLSFLVNSPPSNDTTYLDLGLSFAGGLDVKVIERISMGWDIRYTQAFNRSATNNSYWSTGVYAGLNF